MLRDGRVFCVPSYSQTAIIYDPITDTLITPSCDFLDGSPSAGGVLLADGKVLCVPHGLDSKVRIYDPIQNSLFIYSGSYPNKFYGGVLLPDCRVFCFPFEDNQQSILYG